MEKGKRPPKKGLPDSKRDNKQRKKSKPKLRLPTANKSMWKIVRSLKKNVEGELASDFAKARCSELTQILRQEDILLYIKWCDTVSLVELNKQFTVFTLDNLSDIRNLRILTIAQKYNFSDSPYDQEKIALDTFLSYEALCKQTNQNKIFDIDSEEDTTSCFNDIYMTPILRSARDFIHRVLGYYPPLSEILASTCHGPGATYDKRGGNSIRIMKYYPSFSVTPAAKDLFVSAIKADERWTRALKDHYAQVGYTDEKNSANFNLKEFIYGLNHFVPEDFGLHNTFNSRILFVPKTAKTFRTICSEPTGNIYLQLGTGNVIRKKLKYAGIDLETQVKNQELARRGSTTGKLSTVDLSGASDTIALSWLKLFPPAWAELLFNIRTPNGELPNGNIVHFEKLSAMGNGFSFPVESLIFTALLFGVAEFNGLSWTELLQDVAVYGDDIILPTQLLPDYKMTLKRCGFKINATKTFSDGLIRESCGKDWFFGHDVSRPTFKDKPSQNWEVVRDYNLLYIHAYEHGLRIRPTLDLIHTWVLNPKYGPICENVVAWIFCQKPIKPSGQIIQPNTKCKQAVNWQTPVYALEQTVLRYASPKNVKIQKNVLGSVFISDAVLFKGSPDHLFEYNGLVYLSNVGSTKFHIQRETSIHSAIWSGFGAHSFKYPEAGSNLAWYNKSRLIATTSKIFVPVYAWTEKSVLKQVVLSNADGLNHLPGL